MKIKQQDLYVIMSGVTIFSVHYETAVVQIRLWLVAIDSLIDGKHSKALVFKHQK